MQGGGRTACTKPRRWFATWSLPDRRFRTCSRCRRKSCGLRDSASRIEKYASLRETFAYTQAGTPAVQSHFPYPSGGDARPAYGGLNRTAGLGYSLQTAGIRQFIPLDPANLLPVRTFRVEGGMRSPVHSIWPAGDGVGRDAKMEILDSRTPTPDSQLLRFSRPADAVARRPY